ncbi:MAG TPA: sugar ABC transporter substrate-binding protein [Spirochaetia bacterium]|nr:sugar ABC transporter substrate-binding protein [Spirochaetia bacterium]
MSKRRLFIAAGIVAMVFLTAGSAFAGGKSEQGAAAAGPVTLQYVFWGDQNEVNATKAFTDGYMVKNPDVKISLLHIPQANTYMDKINTLAASHSLPDLGYFQETNVLQWGMNDQFVDLTDFYKNEPAKLDVLKFITPDGKIVGISVANEIQVIWYSKKMFDAAGLPYPPSDPAKAWTWDHFVQVAKELTKDVNGKTPNDAGFDPSNVRSFGTWIQQWYMPWVTFAIANGGGLVSADGKKLLMGEPGTIDAIQKMADLINVDHVSPTPGTQQMPTAAATALLSQQVAMVIDGTWDLLTIGLTKEQSNLDFGVGVLPKMKTLATTSVGTPIVVFKASKHVPEAEQLLKFVMDPNAALPLMQSGLWLPNEVQWYKDPSLISKWVDNPRHPSEYKSAVVDFAINYAHQLPVYYVPQFQKMDDVIEPALNQVWLGQKSAKDVVLNEIMPKITPIFEGK